MIQERILELVKYGLTTGLVDPADEDIHSKQTSRGTRSGRY